MANSNLVELQNYGFTSLLTVSEIQCRRDQLFQENVLVIRRRGARLQRQERLHDGRRGLGRRYCLRKAHI